MVDTTFQDSVQCVLLPPSRLLLTIFGSPHKKIQKIQKHCRKKTFWTFLPQNWIFCINRTFINEIYVSNFNLCIFKLSQPIFVFKNIVRRKPHFKTVFNVYYFPLHGCCYLFLGLTQKNTKNSKTLSEENILDFSSSKLNFLYQ